ncbi:hypothetical protein HK104_005151, partial [Borealophlyctis nickersoniae]
MASLPSFYEYLHKRCEVYYSDRVPLPWNERSKKPLPVTEAMLDLTTALNQTSTSRKVIRPHSLMSALASADNKNRRLLCYDQQDAQELMQLVSSSVTTEQEPSQPLVESLFSRKVLIDEARGVSDAKREKGSIDGGGGQIACYGKLVNQRLPENLRNPFTGMTGGKVTCMQCGYSTAIRHSTFDNLCIPIPAQPHCTIESLLRSYMAAESLDDWTCPKCSLHATLARIDRDLERQKKRVQEAKERRKRAIMRAKKREREREKNAALAEGNADSVVGVNGTVHANRNGTAFAGNGTAETGGATTKTPQHSKTEADHVSELKNLEQKLREELGMLIQLDKDRTVVSEAIKYDVEGDLPPNIKLTKLGGHSMKQDMIAAPPAALCLHMKRSVFLPTGGVMKNNCRVSFDEVLDLGPFCCGVGGRTYFGGISREGGAKRGFGMGKMEREMSGSRMPTGWESETASDEDSRPRLEEAGGTESDASGPVLEEIDTPRGVHQETGGEEQQEGTVSDPKEVGDVPLPAEIPAVPEGNVEGDEDSKQGKGLAEAAANGDGRPPTPSGT